MNGTASEAAQRLVGDYLARVEAALADLPAARRQELVDQVREHLADVVPPGGNQDEAEVRTALDRLGSPADIAAEARRSFPDEARPPAPAPAYSPASPPLHDYSALALLVFGGVIFGVGWIVGVVLLWSSRTWNRRQKLLGTFVVPGGIAGSVLVVQLLWVISATLPDGDCRPTETAVSPRPSVVATSPNPLRSDGEPGAPTTRTFTPVDCDIGPADVMRRVGLPAGLLLPFASAGYLAWRRERLIRRHRKESAD